MRYMGGKARQAKRIVLAMPDSHTLIEPFGGGASITAEAAKSGKYKAIRAYDANESVCIFWSDVLAGWEPPTELSKSDYEYFRAGPDSAMKAWAGFACSYVGKWFGGYGPSASGRMYLEESFRSTIKKRDAMLLADVSWGVSDYQDVPISEDSVVYCDPPYGGSEQYQAVGQFNSEEFWVWASLAPVPVYVSEFSAPDGWGILDEWSRPSTVDHSKSKDRIEKLFTTN